MDKRILKELEVLIVDDGSTDDTAEKAKRYEELYPDTVHVISKENGGHGSAINVGIERAQGVYFKVVDGDDWVDTQNLCQLIRDLEGQDSDLVINPYNKVCSGSSKVKKITLASDYGKGTLFDTVCSDYPQLEIHSITIKTDLLRDHGIRVRERCFYEDSEYDLFPTPFINTVTVLDYPVYQYLVGQTGQSISAFNALKNHRMHFQVIQDCIGFYENWKGKISENKRIYMRNVIFKLIRTQYNIYLRNGPREGSYEKMVEFSEDLKSRYPLYHQEVSRKYGYIRLLQSKRKPVFHICSFSVRIYKKIFHGSG